jgi:hypothetical protein
LLFVVVACHRSGRLDLASKSRRLLALATIVAAMGCRKTPAAAPAPAVPPAAVTAVAPAVGPPPPRGRLLTLVYSSNQLGAYKPCDCAVQPMGGLARRATQLDRARAEADAVLVVEAGDLFTAASGEPAPGAGEVERRARLLAAAYGRMGTTALLPGERDLALGVPLLRRVAKAAGVPLVAANLYGPDGKPLFDTDRIVDAKGLKVGLFGVSAPPSPDEAAAWRRAGVEPRDPVEAARTSVASLRARGAQLVIALLHLPTEADSRALVDAVPGIDWAVLGHVGQRWESAQQTRTGKTWLLSVMPEGKELGRVDLHVVGTPTFVDRGARPELEAILADHRRQLDDYDKRLGGVDHAALDDYYASRRKQLGEAITREQAALSRMPTTITGSWFENRLIPLDAATPDQIGVGVLVDAYSRESDRLAAAGKPVGVGGDRPPAHAALPAPQATGYTGTAACGSCHAPALAFWRTTKHARALAALSRIGRDRNPSCVGCHVTAYLQPGGADLETARKRFANVGCEACHGPGRTHAEARDKRGTLAQAGEATCRGCHTQDRVNGDFDYARLAAAILGPGHGAPAPLAPKAAPPL